MKKILVLLLALVMTLGLCTSALAEFDAGTLTTDKEIPQGLKIAFAYRSFSDKLGSQYIRTPSSISVMPSALK